MRIETYKAIQAGAEQARQELLHEFSWQSLANAGLKQESIVKCQRTKKCTRAEAKETVESFMALNDGGKRD